MVRHGGTWDLDLSGAGLSPSGFLDFFLKGDVVLRFLVVRDIDCEVG